MKKTDFVPSQATRSSRETAFAKINLHLEVLGRQKGGATDGYHDLTSLVVFADFGDELLGRIAPETVLIITGPYAARLNEEARLMAAKPNLILQAALAFQEAFPHTPRMAFHLVKNLPLASGIGGGSADAAAALRLLARAGGVAEDAPELFAIAAKLGADVPVCLRLKSGFMHGTGTKLGAMLALPEIPALLVNPHIALETPPIFQALGLEKGVVRARESAFEAAFTSAAARVQPTCPQMLALLQSSQNDLTAPALKLAPPLATCFAALEALPNQKLVRMSGSGATCFALFETMKDALNAAAELQKTQPDWWVKATSLAGDVAAKREV